MTQIETKRAYDKADPSDGYRILVDRLWPRGVSKEDLAMDYWAKDIAPSTPLRQWYHEDMPGHHAEFVKRYTAELEANPDMGNFIRVVGGKRKVTLLYAAKDPLGNEAAILRDYLRKRI